MKEKILQAHAEHPDWGYGKIATHVGCHKTTVSYYLEPNRKVKSNAARRKRCQSKKESLVMEFGGKCKLCGYSRCFSALEFHHLNPDEKDFAVTQEDNLDKMREEAKKCILICANCHREVEEGLINIFWFHTITAVHSPD